MGNIYIPMFRVWNIGIYNSSGGVQIMKYLKKIRMQLLLNSKEMAEKTNVSNVFYSQVENGKFQINTGMLLKINELCKYKCIEFNLIKAIENKEE